jgi:tetratricopeptide (TPR) repeat protein
MSHVIALDRRGNVDQPENPFDAGLEPAAPDGFAGLFQRARSRIDAYTRALSDDEDLQVRRRRLEDIALVVEAFGLAPSAEIEADALRTRGAQLEELLTTLRAFILTGVDDCRRLEPLLPDERETLRRHAARLEAWGLYWQANLLYAADKYAEAMSTFQRVLARDPGFPRRDSIYASLGMAWEHILEDLERADQMYTEVVNLRKARLEALIAAGLPVRGEGDLPVLGPPGQQSLTPVEAVALALERRGDLRMKRGLYGAAAVDFREARALRGEDPVSRRKELQARWRRLTRPFTRRR